MLVYALGCELMPYVEAIVNAIADDTAKHGNRFSRFVLSIVGNYPFQYRRNGGFLAGAGTGEADDGAEWVGRNLHVSFSALRPKVV